MLAYVQYGRGAAAEEARLRWGVFVASMPWGDESSGEDSLAPHPLVQEERALQATAGAAEEERAGPSLQLAQARHIAPL